MLTGVDFEILFHFASAEGNSACQRCLLGREERKPGAAEAAAEQRAGGCGLQGQCTEALGYSHAKSTPCPPWHERTSRTRFPAALTYSFMSSLALSLQKAQGPLLSFKMSWGDNYTPKTEGGHSRERDASPGIRIGRFQEEMGI